MSIFNPYFKSANAGVQHQVIIGNAPVPTTITNYLSWYNGNPAIGSYGLFQKILGQKSDTTINIGTTAPSVIADKNSDVYFSMVSSASTGNGFNQGAIPFSTVLFKPSLVKTYITRSSPANVQQSLIVWDPNSGQPASDTFLNLTITDTTWATSPKPAWEFQESLQNIGSSAPQTALTRMKQALQGLVTKVNSASSYSSSPSNFQEVNTFFSATYIEITVGTNVYPGIVLTSTDNTRLFDFNLWSSLSAQTGFGGAGDTYIKVFTFSDWSGSSLNTGTIAFPAGNPLNIPTTAPTATSPFVFGNPGSGLPYQVQQAQIDSFYIRGDSAYYPSAGTRPEEWGQPTDVVASLQSVTAYDCVSIIYPTPNLSPVIAGAAVNRYIDIFVPAKTGAIGSSSDFANGIYYAFVGANSPV